MNIQAHPSLETARLRLRIVRTGDEEFLAALYSDPVVMEHIYDGPASHSEALRQARIEIELAEHHHFTGMWLVELRDEGTPVGWVSLGKLRGFERDDLQLGYQFAPAYWGRGYATEASRRLLEYAFERFDLDRVAALVRPANVASLRVLKKLGFTRVRRRKEDSLQWCDEYRLRLATFAAKQE